MAKPATSLPKKELPKSNRASSPKRKARPRAEVILNPRIETRREDARRRAGWNDELAAQPRASISYFLKDISPRECIETLLCDDSPEALKFSQKYFSISESDRHYLHLEDIATLAGLTPRELVQTITGALYSQTRDRQQTIVLRSQPEVVAKTIEMALTPRGDKDREMFHRGTGFLPLPKGAQTTINLNQQNNTAQLPAPTQPVPNVLQGITSEQSGPLTIGSTDEMLLDMQTVVRPALPAPPEPVNSEVPINAPELNVIEADV